MVVYETGQTTRCDDLDLRLRLEPVGDGVRVAVHGALGPPESDHLLRVLTIAVGPGVARVELDLSGVTFCGSAGIRALLQAYEKALAAGCRLCVTHLDPMVHRVFEIAGLVPVLAVTAAVPPEDGKGDGPDPVRG